MTVAISIAARSGAEGRDLRLDRQHPRLRRRLRGRGRDGLRRAGAATARSRSGKLAQAVVHGATAAPGRGQLRRLPAAGPQARRRATRSALVNSVNPDRIEGQKTAAFEIVDALGDAPDVHCLPVGNAGNITAYWKGYPEYAADGRGPVAGRRPRMWGFQAGRRRADRARSPGATPARPSPPRSGSATRRPGSWRWPPGTSRAALIEAVTDEQILAAYRLLAAQEGVFVEPASAASVAGLLRPAPGRAARRRPASSSAPSPATA